MFKQNEGTADRVVRVILGIALLGYAFAGLSGTAQIIALVVGAVALVTGVTGFCALYKLLGISTKKAK